MFDVSRLQKSPWNVSDVDRRETGLFPGKTKTSLSGSLFIYVFAPFHLGKEALARHALELQEARQVRESAPQSCSTRGQHAPVLHQAVLADGQAPQSGQTAS